MCECGCGDGIPVFKFKGPNKSIYVMRIYPGCVDCETPVGAIISKYKNQQELSSWDLESLPEELFNNDLSSAEVAVISPDFVLDGIVDLCGNAVIETEGFDEGDPFTVRELLLDVEDRAAKQVVTMACHKTLLKDLGK